MMKFKTHIFSGSGVVLSLLVLFAAPSARADMAQTLLQASDQARGGLDQGITWTVSIDTWEGGGSEKSTRGFTVKAKGSDVYAEATSPARNVGEIYLFNDRNMWFYKPTLKKPLGISARQKLTGQAANGDIASTNYAKDYTATVEKTDTVNGETATVLMLKAKRNDLTYDRIRYWVTDKSHLAVKAEFLTLEGKVFKRAQFAYQNKINLKGRLLDFVSSMDITDAAMASQRSVIHYSSPKLESQPASLFNVNNLSR